MTLASPPIPPPPRPADGASPARPEWRTRRDPRTGRTVWQVTDHPRRSVAAYFEGQGFTADERWLVFGSQRSGTTQLHRCELTTGRIDPLTRDASMSPLGFAFTMHPDGRRVLYWDAAGLVAVDVETRVTELLVPADVDASPERTGRNPLTVSADGDRVVTITEDLDGASTMRVVDLPTGQSERVLDWPVGVGHAMICPGDRDLISFVPHGDACWQMDLPRERRTRLWMVRVGEGVARRFLSPPHLRTVTHESWSPDGSRLFYFQKTYPDWTPVEVRSVARDGSDDRLHLRSELRLGHGVCSPDGRFFVADVQDPGGSPLLLLDLSSGDHEILCWPDASNEGGHGAGAHVHPFFSPSGRLVCFTSDRTGTPQVYVVPVGEAPPGIGPEPEAQPC